ncbi:hypothetical protein ACS0TY_014281 [Phlomoides rotata]
MAENSWPLIDDGNVDVGVLAELVGAGEVGGAGAHDDEQERPAEPAPTTSISSSSSCGRRSICNSASISSSKLHHVTTCGRQIQIHRIAGFVGGGFDWLGGAWSHGGAMGSFLPFSKCLGPTLQQKVVLGLGYFIMGPKPNGPMPITQKNRIVKSNHIRSGRTVSKHFHRVLNSVISLHSILLSQPKPIDENCTNGRALDGTYINVTVPVEDRARYRNKKGDISVNVLVVCDINMNYFHGC